MMEMLLDLVYRNLIKKTFLTLNALGMNSNNQIPLSCFLAAFASCGCEISVEELESILANLVYRNWIKAYVSSEKKVIVLSTRADPFPSVRSVEN